MEFFGARSNVPIKSCLEEVRGSDLLVVVIGSRYGNLVARRNVSFSEAEYREAYRLRKPCLVYIRDENVPVAPKHIERDPAKFKALERWKRTLQKRHTTFRFSDPGSLALQVTADLSRTAKSLEESRNARQSKNVEVSSAVRSAAQLRQALEDLERAYDATLEALGDALGLSAKEDKGHPRRVTAFTIAIARAMGLSSEKIREIARGAFLHDIGKLAVPDTVLPKPGPLSQEERQMMEQHCVHGFYLLKRIPFLSAAAEIVYAHHERYDGTGYPRQLKGKEIPLGARILSVADAFDVITSDVPYRRAKSFSEAREEISRQAGSQFDPEVVSVFQKIPLAMWEDLRKEIMAQVQLFSWDKEPFKS